VLYEALVVRDKWGTHKQAKHIIYEWAIWNDARHNIKGLKLGKETGVIIESGSGIELPSWGSGSHHYQVQSQERITCQHTSQNFDFGQVQMGVLKLNLGF